MTWLAIFVGGGCGALSRWGLSQWIDRSQARWTAFPLGILCCNLLGCLLIGMATGYLLEKPRPEWLSPLLLTGFLGGFTTFSTFSKDSLLFIQQEQFIFLAFNLLLSVAGGLGAVWLGMKMASA